MQINEVYDKMISKLRGFIVGTNTTPLSLSDLNSIYGDSEAFMKRYREFEEEYISEVVRTNAGRNAPLVSPGEDLYSKGIDFSLIRDRKARRNLEDKFKRKVLKLTGSTDPDGTFRPGLLEHGMPTVTAPSSNPRRGSMRYLVDATDEGGEFLHPAQVLLSRLNINLNPDGPQGLDSITFGGRIMSSMQIESASASGGRVSRPSGGELKRVLTLDIETTGVDRASVARTLSVSESYMNSAGEMVDSTGAAFDSQGRPVSPRVVSNLFLDVDALHGQTVTRSGVTRTMSEHLIEREINTVPGSVVGTTQPEMLDALEGLLRELNSADTVVTYNARFDISKLLQTIEGFDGYNQHQGLMEQLSIFTGRLKEEDFVSDQLVTTSNYLQQQAISIMKEEDPEIFDDSVSASKRFQEILYGRSAGLPGEVGEGLKYAGVTQVADNTNLLDLIRRDAPEVFNEIHSGSHIAANDVIIEDYMRRYMESGELRLDTLERRDIANGAVDSATSYLNDSEIYRARNIIRRSSAINATTDIADPSLMSDVVFRSVLRNLEGVQIDAAILDEAGDTGLMGTIAYDRETGQYQLYNAREIDGAIDQPTRTYTMSELEGRFGPEVSDNFSEYVRATLEDARQGNEAALNTVVKTGINYGTAAKMDRIQNLNLIEIGRRAMNVSSQTLTDEDILSAVGGVYETYGSRKEPLPGFGFLTHPTFFKSGFGRYTASAAADVAERFARIGYGYIGEPEERVVSTILAKHTSGLGRSVEQAVISATETAAGNSPAIADDLRFASKASDLIEMGLSYFKAGTKFNVRNMLEESSGLSNKLIIPLQIVEEAVRRAVDDGLIASEKVIMGGRVSLDDVGFSFGDIRRSGEPDDIGRGVNVVWNVSRNLNKEESRSLAEQLLNIFSDADEVRRILGIAVDEELGPALEATIGSVESVVGIGQSAQAASDGRQAAIDTITRRMRDNIVVGSLDIDEQQTLQLEADLNRVGMDTSTDVISGDATTRILTSGIDTEAGNVGVLAPVRNYEVLQRMGDEAVDLVRDTDENYLRVVGDLAEKIDESPDLGRAVSKKISTAVSGNEAYKASEFYRKYKKKGLIGAGVVATSIVGYYGYKKYQERSVYNETLEEQPYEDRLNKYSLGESYSMSSGRRLDPMDTTPVVNNLNNRKINHTNMSNGKNDHLFSGAF